MTVVIPETILLVFPGLLNDTVLELNWDELKLGRFLA